MTLPVKQRLIDQLISPFLKPSWHYGCSRCDIIILYLRAQQGGAHKQLTPDSCYKPHSQNIQLHSPHHYDRLSRLCLNQAYTCQAGDHSVSLDRCHCSQQHHQHRCQYRLLHSHKILARSCWGHSGSRHKNPLSRHHRYLSGQGYRHLGSCLEYQEYRHYQHQVL
jgi:hypothetical protein